MRFRYPLYYPILFGLAFLLCAFLCLFYLFDGGEIQVILGLAAAAIFWLYLFYGTTQTVYLDAKGIKHNSLFGEKGSLSWSQVVDIKTAGFLSPGLKIADGMGNVIEISAMLNRYDHIVEQISLNTAPYRQKALISAGAEPNSDHPVDLQFKARSWRWIAIPILVGSAILSFTGMLELANIYYKMLSGIFALVIFPGALLSFFRQPVLIATRGDRLSLHFQSNLFRSPIQVSAGEIRAIGFNQQRSLSAHGEESPITQVVILFADQTRVVVGNTFTASPEEIYMGLSTWVQVYRPAENTDD